MGKWAIKSAGGPKKALLMGDGGVVRMLEYEAEKIRVAHNADIDRLTAERDALTKRINPEGVPVDIADLCVEIDRVTDERDDLRAKLDAVLKILKPKPPECAIDEQGGDEDEWIAWDEAMVQFNRAKAIAEGTS